MYTYRIAGVPNWCSQI